jgi:hypothetical protein
VVAVTCFVLTSLILSMPSRSGYFCFLGEGFRFSLRSRIFLKTFWPKSGYIVQSENK